jgi:hypothetical protein
MTCEVTTAPTRCAARTPASTAASDGRDVAARLDRHHPGIDVGPAGEIDRSGFRHRVRGLDERDPAARFDHAQRLSRQRSSRPGGSARFQTGTLPGEVAGR